MRQSRLFTKILHNAPKDEVSVNAQLLIRGGYIHKVMAGVYEFLPLGLRVLDKVNAIIREEMNKIGGEELFLSALQDKTTWEKTGRWNDNTVDIWFKTKLKNDSEVGLSFTHEEPLTSLMKSYVNSYRDLPIFVYQIQTKFRNEVRAKSGIMRGREFLMKDLYSFCRSTEEHEEFYEKAKLAYLKIFERMGLGDKTYVTYASGGSFSKYSHEFQTVTEAGEDTIFVCGKCRIAINNDIALEQKACPGCGLAYDKLKSAKAVEVGNIFSLGTKFSDAFDLNFTDEEGNKKPVIMGSYGIGPGRLIGTIVELFHDENGIIWPESVAPFSYHLLNLSKSKKEADELYQSLHKHGISVLYDDRDLTAGVKFAESDLLGIPNRLVISDKTLKEESVELKARNDEKKTLIKLKDLIKHVTSKK